jgi:hypothetical protein
MSEIWFTATKKFDPSLDEEWAKYYEWANIPQLKAIVSLDITHRPQDLWELVDSDWEYNIHKDFLITFFWDLDYLLKRFAEQRDSINILAVCLEPSSDARELFQDPRFAFQGYDLVGNGDVSAINNCGGFDLAFQTSDISEVGLFDSYELAREVQDRLRQHYPDEPHARCELWAIWRVSSQ